jgi:hypothetical protein
MTFGRAHSVGRIRIAPSDSSVHRPIPHPIGLSILLLAAFVCASAVDAPKSPARQRLDGLREQVRAAHSSSDAAAYLAKSREMMEFLNASPTSILQVMSAQAFSRNDDGALASFERFIAGGQSSPGSFEGPVFAELRKSDRFKAAEARMRKNEEPVATSTAVFEVPDAGLIPEDVDYDPPTRRFYISSVLKGEILSFDSAGHSAVFARAPDSLPMMGLKVDAKRRRLWVTEAGLNGFASIPKEKWRDSVILVYDIDSGRVVHRIAGPPHATLGDMVLTPEGDAIASDNDGGVYRVYRDSWRTERLDSGEFISPQTPAISSDGRIAYIPDYLRGVAMLDLRTRAVTWMGSDGTHALNGIDGLYLSGRTMLATQNGSSPERVIRFELNESKNRIESETVIERATATLGDPTHGVLLNGLFYYIANSGWDALNDDGTPRPGSTPSKAILMRYSLQPTHQAGHGF